MRSESSEEEAELKLPENGKEAGCELFYDTISSEWDKEKTGNMSGHHSSEFKIDSKKEDIKKNSDSLEDPPVFHMEKNVTACDLTEIIVSNYKELTYSVVKDICVNEGVPMMQEKFLFNEKDSVGVNANPFESKSSEDGNFVGIQDCSKHNQENLIVTGQEVKEDSQVYHEVTSGSVSKEALTLGDIISMEDSQKPPNNNTINGPEESVVRETKEEKTEEPKADNVRYLSFEMAEAENPLLNDVLEDSYNHNHLFSRKFANGFGERSFSEGESGLAHITYSGPISVSGSLSVGSDGSTVSAHSFAFPILQPEWSTSPVRMVKAEKRQLRKEKGWRHYSLLLCCKF